LPPPKFLPPAAPTSSTPTASGSASVPAPPPPLAATFGHAKQIQIEDLLWALDKERIGGFGVGVGSRVGNNIGGSRGNTGGVVKKIGRAEISHRLKWGLQGGI
jgi:hypothetical protein